MSYVLVRSDLESHPKVLRISHLLGQPNHSTCCGLLELWGWVYDNAYADTDSLDYFTDEFTSAEIEAAIKHPGLLAAMCHPDVTWCECTGDEIVFRRLAKWDPENFTE